MLKKDCKKCGHVFDVRGAVIPENWRSWIAPAEFARCPNCHEEVKWLAASDVDTYRSLNIRTLSAVLVFILLWLLGMVTGLFPVIGVLMVAGLGVWLARSAQLRDHRIIGWVLIGFALLPPRL